MTRKIRHTRSTSGCTHRLTVTMHSGHYERRTWNHTVQLRFITPPRFDDQVQGMLIRKFWSEIPNGFAITGAIGIVPGGVTVDTELDQEEEIPPALMARMLYQKVFGDRETITADEALSFASSLVRADRGMRVA